MKQIEFDERIREMRKERNKELSGLRPMVQELDIKINELGSQSHRIVVEQKMLKVQRSAMCKRLNEIEAKWNKRLAEFRDANPYSELESKLEDVSEFCIVRELVRRGFHGTIDNEAKSEEFMTELKKLFSGGGISSGEQHEATE